MLTRSQAKNAKAAATSERRRRYRNAPNARSLDDASTSGGNRVRRVRTTMAPTHAMVTRSSQARLEQTSDAVETLTAAVERTTATTTEPVTVFVFTPAFAESIGQRYNLPTPVRPADANFQHALLNFLNRQPAVYARKVLTQLMAMPSYPYKQEDDSNGHTSCSICLLDYCQNQFIIQLPCAHEFHVNCASAWLSRNHTCPLCRRAVIGVHGPYEMPPGGTRNNH